MLSIIIPLIMLVAITLGLLGYYAVKYNRLSRNETLGSKFSVDFKEDLDLKMYWFTIGSRFQKELPMKEVEDAIALGRDLQKTTYHKDSRKALNHMLDYCDNLKKRMNDIDNETNYDKREKMLELNIRVLTNLIQTEMQNYIYYEAVYLAELESKMMSNIKISILILLFFSVVTVILLTKRAFKLSKEISAPIQLLGNNVRTVGRGIFQIPSVETYDYEIMELNEGIQKMATRIESLIEKVKSEELERHITELQLIQEQVNPHFLYNTLDTIVWLIETDKKKDAIEMITQLSVFFRTSLSNGYDVITMQEEVSHTESYLQIQQRRYGDIMDYEIDIPETLMKIRIPKLTIQPLIENSLYHGIKNTRKAGFISIKGIDLGENFMIQVGDNGIGISPEKMADIQNTIDGKMRTGFGIKAVHERIKLYCGSDYGIKIQSQEGKGTIINVLISKNIQL